LRSQGYKVALADNTRTLLAAEAREQPVTVLLDENVPDCVEAVRLIREASGVPVVFISFADEPAAVSALHAGADAVLKRPYSSVLLIAMVDCLVKRGPVPTPESIGSEFYERDDLFVDLAAHTATLRGQRLRLSAREYKLLSVLAVNAGLVMTHSQLLRLTWGHGYEDSDELLRSYVRNLRKKLGEDARRPQYIFTESQVGYRMPRSGAA
jgi:two-component system KDP operon response regulator KdpE